MDSTKAFPGLTTDPVVCSPNYEISQGKTYFFHTIVPDLLLPLAIDYWDSPSYAEFPYGNSLISSFCSSRPLSHHRLPSDSTSRRTPLPRLAIPTDTVRSGLSPPKNTPCLATRRLPALLLRAAYSIPNKAHYLYDSMKNNGVVIICATTSSSCDTPLPRVENWEFLQYHASQLDAMDPLCHSLHCY